MCYSALLCVVTQTHRWMPAVIIVQRHESDKPVVGHIRGIESAKMSFLLLLFYKEYFEQSREDTCFHSFSNWQLLVLNKCYQVIRSVVAL